MWRGAGSRRTFADDRRQGGREAEVDDGFQNRASHAGSLRGASTRGRSLGAVPVRGGAPWLLRPSTSCRIEESTLVFQLVCPNLLVADREACESVVPARERRIRG